MYSIPNATRKDDVNAMGLYESDDIYAQEDLNLFFSHYAPNVPNGTHPLLDSIDGGHAPVAQDDELNGGESVIDMNLGFSLIYVSLPAPCNRNFILTLCVATNYHTLSSER